MSDYSKGKIYKITSPSLPGECYIGSTVAILKRRMSQHKYECKQSYSGIRSKLIMCNGDAIIELIEDYPCANKTELARREGIIMKEYMNNDEMDNVVNYLIAGRTSAEYYQDNIIEIRRKRKIYSDGRKDKQRAYDQVYKIGREEHKSAVNKAYRINKKAEIKIKRSIKINCEFCGELRTKENIRQHHRTLKCQAFQEQKSKKGSSVA